ncbi:hypothetical protein MBLNU13_g00485t1 [Cladosporium sp. NU13]
MYGRVVSRPLTGAPQTATAIFFIGDANLLSTHIFNALHQPYVSQDEYTSSISGAPFVESGGKQSGEDHNQRSSQPSRVGDTPVSGIRQEWRTAFRWYNTPDAGIRISGWLQEYTGDAVTFDVPDDPVLVHLEGNSRSSSVTTSPASEHEGGEDQLPSNDDILARISSAVDLLTASDGYDWFVSQTKSSATLHTVVPGTDGLIRGQIFDALYLYYSKNVAITRQDVVSASTSGRTKLRVLFHLAWNPLRTLLAQFGSATVPLGQMIVINAPRFESVCDEDIILIEMRPELYAVPDDPTYSHCWHQLFRNPVIAHGYPTHTRSEKNTGLEIGAHMMAILGRTHWVTVFRSVFLLKGVVSAFIPVDVTEHTVSWHFVMNSTHQEGPTVCDEGCVAPIDRLSYNDALSAVVQAAPSESIGLSSLASKRHFVGLWTERSRVTAGREEGSYDVKQSASDADVPAGLSITAVAVGGGKYDTGILTFAARKKDTSVYFVCHAADQMVIDAASTMTAVFYDTFTRRACLLNCQDAIAYCVCAWLASASAAQNALPGSAALAIGELDNAFSRNDQHASDVLMSSSFRRIKLFRDPSSDTAGSLLRDSVVLSSDSEIGWTIGDLIGFNWERLQKICDHNWENSKGALKQVRSPAQVTTFDGYDLEDIHAATTSIEPRRAQLRHTAGHWPSLVQRIPIIPISTANVGEMILPVEQLGTFLHIILALAALHLTAVRPEEQKHKWYALSISHHGAAIKLARPHITASTSIHAEAIFNFSGFNSLFSFAEPVLRPITSDLSDYIGDLLDSFRMARGIRAIIAKNPQLLADKGLTNNPAWSYNTTLIESTLTEKFPQVLELERLANQHIMDPEQLNATVKSIRRLFINMAVLDDSPKDHSSASLIQRWPIEFDTSFLALCESRHPIALVLLAWYALLCQKRANIWFFQRWPRVLLHAIDREVQGTEWAPLIVGPAQEIERLMAMEECNEKV